MRAVVETIERLVARDASILLTGESGTGKNFVAAAVHAAGPRASAPFVHIDCASIPHDLFESELFGHEKGTFTDAEMRRVGKLEAAQNGTVYFDEIAALSPPLQAKLLRAIEEHRFSRLGGSATISLAARVISSTSADLEQLVASGLFRSDLLYRINVVTVALPPLRERREDIIPLAKEFLRATGRKEIRGFDDAAVALLTSYAWPGNIRELRNAVDRAALLTDGSRIPAAALDLGRFTERSALLAAARSEQWTLDELERLYIAEILRETGSNYSRAAAILGINRKTLLEKRKKYGID